jgi:hypothetical protein
MKVYFNSATEAAPIVIDGDPPTDQSALVAQLQAQVAALTVERDARQAAIVAMKAAAQADKDADAANAAGQGVLDAAGTF